MKIKTRDDWDRQIRKIESLSLLLAQVPVEDMLDSIEHPESVLAPFYIPNLHRGENNSKESDRAALEAARVLYNYGRQLEKETE